MAKTAPLKKKAASVHSRAAKRASSPSIDTDKSLKNVEPPSESKGHRPSILAVHQSAGVSKKSKNGRKAALSTKAKKRQERGMDRAEAVMDKSETRVEKSKGRARTVQERAKAWDELNKRALAAKKQSGVALEKENLDEDEVDMEGVEGDDVEAVGATIASQSASLLEPTEDNDEIL